MPVPFDNKGIVQKKDPSQLAPGELYQSENAWSMQEGAITSRTGHKQLTPASLAAPIVSLSKLNLGGADASNPRYIGSGTKIYRTDSSYAETSVYSGLTSGQRWSAQQYNAGTAGTPSLFLATKTASVRDNGAYTTLQKWGIDPPPVPVTATVNVPNSSSLAVTPGGGTSARFVVGVNSDGSGNKATTAFGAGTGYVKITPDPAAPTNGLNGIYVGMLLTINDGGSTETVIVLALDATSLYAVTTNSHTAGVTLSYLQNSFSTIVGSNEFYFNGFTIDASFNGTAENGYDTDDNFHIALRCTDVTNVTKIQIQVVPNYTAVPPPNATDYYSYDVIPAAVMVSGSATSPNWVELNIPKNAFTKNGNAGAGAFTWKNINEVYVVSQSLVSGATVGISSIYFVGGGGLNSSAAGTTSYSWLYAYRNPTSQAIGNPCPFMIGPNLPPPITNGKVTLTLRGTALAATQANGIGEISGPGSIVIYRAGGTFSDGLYRKVGYATNPGSGATVSFVDNASDASLNTADTLEFDNNPPVLSNLPVPLTANLLHFQPSGGGTDFATSSQANSGSATALTTNATIRLVLSNLPTNFVASTIASVITVGSTLQVATGNTFETCTISSVGYGTGVDTTSAWLEVYLQFNHNVTSTDPSETVECGAINRGTCDLIHQEFDCLFLAGDSNNPATLYQSKVGRPEAFPLVNLENGFAQQVNVGSPSNPINGITSIGPGELVCLNLDEIFIVQVWAGQLQQPIKAPASRGLYAKWCWCKGDNRIWYLAYDGIYTWAGGESQKVSEKIDYMFKRQTVNGIPPIDFTLASLFSFSYAENCLFIGYIDTNGLYHRLRYETIYDRWTIDSIIDGSGGVYAFNCLFTEPDTGNFLVAITNTSALSYLWLCDFYSTTDGWVTLPTDGLTIKYTIWRYWPIGDPTADFQIGEVILEMQNPADATTADLYFNYATTATNTITIAAGTVPARNRFFSAVNSAVTAVQYSIGLRLTGATGEAGLTTFYTFAWRDFPWSDSGYGCPKVFGWLDVQANTNGVSVPMQLQLDGVSVYSFSISGTFFNRASTITLPSNLIGTQWRVVPVSGYQGTLQIYSITPKIEKLPCAVTHWDSLYQIYGSAGWKFVWQVWVDYQSAVPLVFSIYRDGDVLFYQVTIPAMAERGVTRFYLPPVNTPAGGVTPQFNKSQGYRCWLDSSNGTTTFQLYRDGSRIETRNLDGDQRSGFEEHIIWELMPVQS